MLQGRYNGWCVCYNGWVCVQQNNVCMYVCMCLCVCMLHTTSTKNNTIIPLVQSSILDLKHTTAIPHRITIHTKQTPHHFLRHPHRPLLPREIQHRCMGVPTIGVDEFKLHGPVFVCLLIHEGGLSRTGEYDFICGTFDTSGCCSVGCDGDGCELGVVEDAVVAFEVLLRGVLQPCLCVYRGGGWSVKGGGDIGGCGAHGTTTTTIRERVYDNAWVTTMHRVVSICLGIHYHKEEEYPQKGGHRGEPTYLFLRFQLFCT